MNAQRLAAACAACESRFSAYLDGDLSGRRMAEMASHLAACGRCRDEFAAWRTMSSALAAAGRTTAPDNLQQRLLAALATERAAGSHLTAPRRIERFWERSVQPFLTGTFAPLALRATAALVVAAGLLGGLTWLYAAPLSVEANDDAMTHLQAPHYLYSQVPAQAIATPHDAPVLIEARIDRTGRVYDYTILAGPSDPGLRLAIEKNLLASVFRPASLFGAPVRGHVMLTYSGVSVRG